MLEIDGTAQAIFGCYLHEVGNWRYGNIWCFATPEFGEEVRWIRRHSRRVVDWITRGCDVSGNVVDCEETAHVRWLRWLGYEMTEEPVNGKLEFAKKHHGRTSNGRDPLAHPRSRNHGSAVCGGPKEQESG